MRNGTHIITKEMADYSAMSMEAEDVVRIRYQTMTGEDIAG
jgi:hypothetical protein